jgi:hypothetical protein
MKFRLENENLAVDNDQWFVIESKVIDSLNETNDSFSYYKDPLTFIRVFQCKNKPKDYPEYGIKWIEYNK